ncbi:MAG: glycosyltransferase 87 family protein [Promethearchaeota archaeon]
MLESFIEDIRFCNRYIKKSITLKLSLYAILIYVIFTITCFILIPNIIPLENILISHDFRIFYESTKLIIIDPGQLYDPVVNDMSFRYLPIFSLLFIPYILIPYELAFIAHTILMAFLHICSFYLILILSTKFFKISFNTKIKRDMLLISLMAPLQVVLLFIGQVTEIYIFIILLVVLLLENEKNRRYEIKYANLIVGLLVGISMAYKPFAFLLIPILLKISFSYRNKKFQIEGKQIAITLIGFLIPFILNVLYFILYPNLITGFIRENSTSQFSDYPSTSITRIIFVFFSAFSLSISEIMILVISTPVLYIIILILFYLMPNNEKNYSMFFGMAMLIMLITFTDSWFLNFLIWYMISLPGLLKLEEDLKNIISDKNKRKFKQTYKMIYRISQYGTLFFGIGVVIGLTIFPIDPILPIFLLILYILFFWRLLVFSNKNN